MDKIDVAALVEEEVSNICARYDVDMLEILRMVLEANEETD